MKKRKILLCAFLFSIVLFAANSCLELYNPPTSTTNYNYLVVDGFLNGLDTTIISLSRTQPLANTSLPTFVANATVQIEDDQGGIYGLTSTDTGSYYIPPQNWSTSLHYRIRISAKDPGREYLSDFVPLTPTPPIDSVTWKLEPSGSIQINVNTHDPTNQVKYYLWTYVETWEYTPPFRSYFVFGDSGKVLPRTDDIYHCWRTQNSTQIFITTSSKLSENIVSQFPLNLIGPQDARLQYRYSTLVKQQGLTEEAYQYWSTLQKNTENLGTLFGPQPSQLTGNIHCLNVPSEVVLGYFNATSEQDQRLFISHQQVPNITHYLGYDDCQFVLLAIGAVPKYDGGDLITEAVFQGRVLIGYTIASPGCVDCRYHGGVTTQPSFW